MSTEVKQILSPGGDRKEITPKELSDWLIGLIREDFPLDNRASIRVVCGMKGQIKKVTLTVEES